MGDPRDSDAKFRGRDPWNLAEIRSFGRAPHEIAGELQSRALAAIEAMPGASDAIRQGATQIIETQDDKYGTLARHALITSSPAYLRAWQKCSRGEQYLLDQDEARAIETAKAHSRAMSLTDSAGGYAVPFQLDPTVIVTSSGTYSDIRSLARVVVATGDTWHGVTSANVSWSFDAEASEVSDDSPTFGQPAISNYMARGFVPISIEAMADVANVTQTVGELLAGGKMDLEGTKFITGSGTGEPTGIITALVAAGSPTVVNSLTTDTFALADVYALQGALAARYRPNASWLANNLVYNKTRQFDTAGGNGLWAQLGDGRPPVLLGRKVAEAEAMDGVINSSAENYALIFGDFGQGFVITDRLGMQVEFVQTFFGANRRPSGQRGFFAYYRTGSGVTNPDAFRLLDVT